MGRGTWSWIGPDGLYDIAKPLIPEQRTRPQGGGTANPLVRRCSRPSSMRWSAVGDGFECEGLSSPASRVSCRVARAAGRRASARKVMLWTRARWSPRESCTAYAVRARRSAAVTARLLLAAGFVEPGTHRIALAEEAVRTAREADDPATIHALEYVRSDRPEAGRSRPQRHARSRAALVATWGKSRPAPGPRADPGRLPRPPDRRCGTSTLSPCRAALLSGPGLCRRASGPSVSLPALPHPRCGPYL